MDEIHKIKIMNTEDINSVTNKKIIHIFKDDVIPIKANIRVKYPTHISNAEFKAMKGDAHRQLVFGLAEQLLEKIKIDSPILPNECGAYVYEIRLALIQNDCVWDYITDNNCEINNTEK